MIRNWRGTGKVSYQDIISLESHFEKGEVFPFLSSTKNSAVIDDPEIKREYEKKDERDDRIVAMIKANHHWKHFVWEVEPLPRSTVLFDSEDDVEDEDVREPPVVAEKPRVEANKGKRKLNDPGAESRKKQLLCQREFEHNTGVSGEMKSIIEGMFTSFKEMAQKDLQEHFDKVDTEVAHIKEKVSQITGSSDSVGKSKAAEIPTPSEPLSKDQETSSQSSGPSATLGEDQAKSSQSTRPSAGKGKGNAAESADPHPLRRSPQTVRKVIKT
ncbi:unnamed protein product [Eruca vesicaria subsp. sativa]|uniref:Uncharacterized protein n=1 Tax=Eruca vesicaria subsp. sativa TaxID=29727 RepID=A0ABC8LHT1_ERUVS|nr:unnamed protein product [Eruca vesicaria subsp. sativa]